ncbi:MAG: D-ribose ABC transporter substrate-binding protein [Candidatus Hydrogenedentota bacterium]
MSMIIRRTPMRVWVAALCVWMSVTACSPSAPPDGDAEDSASKPTVALIMKSLANEFFKTMEEGAKKHSEANADSYTLIVQGIKNELDIDQQIQLIEQMIARNVDAIVIAPADSKAIVPVCKRAIEAGIVVINIDNKFDEAVLKERDVKIPFVGPNNREGARKVGEFLAKSLQSGDPVAIVEGAPNAFNATQRRLGFEDAINEAGLTLVTAQTANWEMDQANQVVSAIATEHPEVKAYLCANDNMALGAVAALKAANKLEAVRVVGFDNISAVQDLVKQGQILATADQHADQLAVFGIEHALAVLRSGEALDDRETPVDLITAESLPAQ